MRISPMCTLSWKPFQDGYTLYFNRDEQRSRPVAAPPASLSVRGMRCLAPRDGAGGTWLLANARGLSLGLLNHYPEASRDDPVAAHSRGLLPLEWADSRSVEEAVERCAAAPLARYRPFRLVAADAERAALLTWDQRAAQLTWLDPAGAMLTSSSHRPGHVEQARRALFQALVGGMELATLESLEAFHHHRGPEAAESIRMARPDACTHSISRIAVSWRTGSLGFRYEPQEDISPVLPGGDTFLLLDRRRP